MAIRKTSPKKRTSSYKKVSKKKMGTKRKTSKKKTGSKKKTIRKVKRSNKAHPKGVTPPHLQRWLTHLNKYAAEHGLTLGAAMKPASKTFKKKTSTPKKKAKAPKKSSPRR